LTNILRKAAGFGQKRDPSAEHHGLRLTPKPRLRKAFVPQSAVEALLDVQATKREAQIGPDGVADDVGRETVAGVQDECHPQPCRRFEQPLVFP
jgi:hypothetical protein